MKITDTFIAVADDCPNAMGVAPPQKGEGRTIARLHYDLLSEHPYEFDIDALNFEVYCLKNHIAPEHRDAHRVEFFAKGHPCMRASPLTKSYGFGAHYDGAGRIAIYPVDSRAYSKFLDSGLRVEKAMRGTRIDKKPRSKREKLLLAEAAGANPSRGPQGFKPAA